MCADWAIHDSENDKGQHNLHIHVLLTMPAKQEVHSAQYATYKSMQIKSVAVSVKSEVMEMIAKVRGRKGSLDLPIVSGKLRYSLCKRSMAVSARNRPEPPQ